MAKQVTKKKPQKTTRPVKRPVKTAASIVTAPTSALSHSAGAQRLWAVGLGLVVLLFDQLSKNWALMALESQNIDVIDGWLQWALAFNRGASFSMLADWTYAPYKLTLLAIVAVGLIWWWLGKPESKLCVAGLGLVLGGAVGNMVDRLQYGAVVDFIRVYHDTWAFPTFNVADSAITVGVIFILLDAIITTWHAWKKGR